MAGSCCWCCFLFCLLSGLSICLQSSKTLSLVKRVSNENETETEIFENLLEKKYDRIEIRRKMCLWTAVVLRLYVRMSISLWMLRWSSYWWTNCSFYVKFVLQSCSLGFWDVVIVTVFILNCVPLQRFCVNDTTFR